MRYSERDTYLRGKNSYKSLREKEGEREYCDFRILTRERFSDCNCGFVHRWIRLIFGHQVLRAWYIKLSGWIGRKICVKRDKCFALSVLYFGVLSSSLYCTNCGFVLIWLFVIYFNTLVGGFLVSSLIIVKLFFFYLDDPWFLPLYWGIFHVKQIVYAFLEFLFYVLYFIGAPHRFF